MKNNKTLIKLTSLILAGAILFSSCVSTTSIQSVPSGAKVYIDGQPAGTTPYTYSDTKIVGSMTTVKLEKEGYETTNVAFSRSEQADVGAIIGGILVWFPFLWTMKYNPVHTYELSPVSTQQGTPANAPFIQNNQKSKAENLRELKQLLDDKIITQEEFDKEKKKILE